MFFSDLCPCSDADGTTDGQWDNDACPGYFEAGHGCDDYLLDVNWYVKELCRDTCGYCTPVSEICVGNTDTCDTTDLTDGPGM